MRWLTSIYVIPYSYNTDITYDNIYFVFIAPFILNNNVTFKNNI
jgi:hypothetical protein